MGGRGGGVVKHGGKKRWILSIKIETLGMDSHFDLKL